MTLNFKSARLKKRRKFQKLVFGNRRERKTERKKDREKESQREREIESEKREWEREKQRQRECLLKCFWNFSFENLFRLNLLKRKFCSKAKSKSLYITLVHDRWVSFGIILSSDLAIGNSASASHVIRFHKASHCFKVYFTYPLCWATRCKPLHMIPFSSRRILEYKNKVKWGAAIAQWIRLRLPSCRPGFESQANHLHFFQFILFKLYICIWIGMWKEQK